MTDFPTFVDVLDPDNPPVGATGVDAAFLNSVTGAVNVLETAPPPPAVTPASIGAAAARGQVVNVDTFIPAGTDTTATNCSPYFAQAVTAAAVNGVIEFSGRYRCDNELVLLNFQVLRGTNQMLGTGGLPNNVLDFRSVVANAAEGNTKVGIRMAASNVLEDFLAYGPGDNVSLSRGVAPPAASSASSPRLRNVSLYNWERGLHLVGAYYTRLYDCTFQYCGTGLYADSCYNLNLYGAKFTCRSADGTRNGIGIQVVGLARGLCMFGGSIEDYSTAILAANRSSITLDGVYAETAYVGAIFLDCIDGGVGFAVRMTGCSIYILNHTYVVRFMHQTSSSLVGYGNKWIYNQIDPTGPNLVAAPTSPIIFAIIGPAGSTSIDLFGDNALDAYYSFPNQTWGYTDNVFTTGPIANCNVRYPFRTAGATPEYRASYNLEGRTVVYPYRVVTVSSTLLITDHWVLVNAAGTTTQKLPAVFGQVPGRTISVKNIGAGTATIATAEASGVTIEGSATLTAGQGTVYMLYGGNWIVAP